MPKQPTKQLAAIVFLWQYDALRQIATDRGISMSVALREHLLTLKRPTARPTPRQRKEVA